MQRRQFLRTTGGTAALALSGLPPGRTLAWDHAKGLVVGDEETNRLLRRPYRAPYVHPDPASI